jgi:hypothetical protein
MASPQKKKSRKKSSLSTSIANDIANTKRIKKGVEETAVLLDKLINQPPANENPEQPSTQPVLALSPSKSNKNVKFSQV